MNRRENNGKKPFYKRWWFITIAIITGLMVVSSASGNSTKNEPSVIKSETSTTTGEQVSEQSAEQEIKVGDTFTFGDFTFKTGNKRNVKPQYSTDEYVVIDVTITANEDSKTFFGQVQGVTADNIVVNPAFYVDETVGDSLTTAWTKDLSKGQSAKGYVAFKVSEGVTKIELTSSMWSDEKATIIL